jgi:hypothetical protein
MIGAGPPWVLTSVDARSYRILDASCSTGRSGALCDAQGISGTPGCVPADLASDGLDELVESTEFRVLMGATLPRPRLYYVPVTSMEFGHSSASWRLEQSHLRSVQPRGGTFEQSENVGRRGVELLASGAGQGALGYVTRVVTATQKRGVLRHLEEFPGPAFWLGARAHRSSEWSGGEVANTLLKPVRPCTPSFA